MLKRNIHFIIFPDVNLLDLSGPLQVFSTANELMEQRGDQKPYNLHVIASEAGIVKTSTALPLFAEPLPNNDELTDTLIVIGGAGIYSAVNDMLLIEWLKNRAYNSRRIAAVCSGAFLLAACGILDGRRAVTHWSVSGEFAQKYPLVIVENNPIFIQDGSVWTSAGVTAGIDLALALITEDLGYKLALEVARTLVVFLKRPGGQAQFSTTLFFQNETERFSELYAWITDNLTADLSISALATFSCMSERSFVRHFLKDTGITPAKAVQQLRLEAARRMLVDTDLPIKRIAERCGFNAESTLRRRFLEHYGNYPNEYRRYFT